MAQIELEQCEDCIKQLKEQSEQDHLRIDNKVLAASLASGLQTCFMEQNIADPPSPLLCMHEHHTFLFVEAACHPMLILHFSLVYMATPCHWLLHYMLCLMLTGILPLIMVKFHH